MVTKLLRVFGDSNEKQIKRLQWLVDKINALEPRYQSQSDAALSHKAAEFRERLAQGGSLDDLLPETFASVREAAHRTIGLRHFDVQLIGGGVLHNGKVAEMKTGEGKTLVATLALFLNALPGKGAHLVTVNDYLARRDTVWMGPIYHALGLTVGCLQHEEAFIFDPQAQEGEGTKYAQLRPIPRRDAYAADITYGTNNEFGFDYLRDNMVVTLDDQVQRPLFYAIVDEVDNILIDEARTPLIISGPTQESTQLYQTFAQLAPRLINGEDYTVAEKDRNIILTDLGITKVEHLLNIENLYDPANYVLAHYVENALRAQVVYQRDKEYVLKDGELIIVDEFTGRLMEGRRYADGLHQALEAKERVHVQQETATYATITLQNYFRTYPKLAGMTGTALTEAEEFAKVYKLEVVAVPTHQQVIRQDLPDFIYKTESAKFTAAAEDIAELHRRGAPVLIGTVSIERSEHLSEMLHRRGIPHEVLNAKQHEREATIIAQAGRPGAVTVATNMAGRGTDIVLGGDTRTAESPEQWQRDHDDAIAAGGLHVIGTERHESRRIDNQLRGRSGRQGDPGLTRFYSSLEDEIIRRFGGDRMKTIMEWAHIPDDVPLESRLVSKVVDSTQAKVEAYNFDIRKHLVEYDDVVNAQRDTIYTDRLKALANANLEANVQEMVSGEVAGMVRSYLSGDPEGWDIESFLAELATLFPLPAHLNLSRLLTMSAQEIEDEVMEAAAELYEQREREFGEETIRALERGILLQTVARLWVQHLTSMQNLRQGIGLYAYGQRDPLVMYKMEGQKQFSGLLENIRHDVAHTVYHVVPAGRLQAPGANGQMAAISTTQPQTVMAKAAGPRRVVPSAIPKVGRNDSCPCGSGKKYKKCHGANL